MKLETLQDAQRYTFKDEVKAVEFVTALVESGANLGGIYFNDFENCPAPKVYIHKNFSKDGTRTYKRFSSHDYQSALKWVLS